MDQTTLSHIRGGSGFSYFSKAEVDAYQATHSPIRWAFAYHQVSKETIILWFQQASVDQTTLSHIRGGSGFPGFSRAEVDAYQATHSPILWAFAYRWVSKKTIILRFQQASVDQTTLSHIRGGFGFPGSRAEVDPYQATHSLILLAFAHRWVSKETIILCYQQTPVNQPTLSHNRGGSRFPCFF